jgi:citrate lyase beta subunit
MKRPGLTRLHAANKAFAKRFPGDHTGRQPVHTVYGGAHLFVADTARKLGESALRALADYAPDAPTLAAAVGADLPPSVYERVVEKLRREPIEDYRIDFEDGYGNRPDAEEDGHAAAAAREVAKGMKEGTLPPFIGIRIKPLTEELHARSIRTLEIFLTTLRKPPANFVVTLPKITIPEQVATLANLMALLERRLKLRKGALEIELMIETPQSIPILRELAEAAKGRCTGAHFGTYDYTAGCSITAEHQRMDHPACDFAKEMMKIAYAGTPITLSDGATNVMPVPVHRGSPTPAQVDENRRAVHAAWKLHYGHIRHSLLNGYYQGWDLHPAQLPTRYAAVYSFFLEGAASAGERLRSFVEKAAKAMLSGAIFDDAATGQGLLNFFLRGISAGAISEQEAVATGVTIEELRERSFVNILKNRAGR